MDLKLELKVVPVPNDYVSNEVNVQTVASAPIRNEVRAIAARSVGARSFAARGAKVQAIGAGSAKALNLAIDTKMLHEIAGNRFALKLNEDGKYEILVNVDTASLWHATSVAVSGAEATESWLPDKMDFFPVEWMNDNSDNANGNQAWGQVSNYGN